VREHIDAGLDHSVHAGLVLRMGEYRLALGMRDIDGGLGGGRIHVHDGLVTHERTGKQLDAVQAQSEEIARLLRSFPGCADFGHRHLFRHIDGMPAFREHIAGKQDSGTGHFARIDAPAQR
jgi:hypothetical protein